jgi:tetratricopeptide (TPR) repeat protein
VIRPPTARLGVLLAALALLGGCVYYNGMYNTNRLAKSARKAERDGRVFEANNLWGQVITRAETLVVRHPRSKYVDQANMLRGLALARLDQCPAAVDPLGRPSVIDRSGDLAEEAALALGNCRLELGDLALADIAFARVLDSRDPRRRHEARVRHAHILRVTGRYEEALAIMRQSSGSHDRNELVLALAGAGHTDEAFALADSLLAKADTSFVWDSLVAELGREDPRTASVLVTRLQADPRATPEIKARRLHEDAIRLAAVDSASSLARLEEAAALPGHTESSGRARLRLLQRRLSGARTLEDLAPIHDSLAVLGKREGGAGAEATVLAATASRLRSLADSVGPGMPQGDLRLFLGAEAARDTLGAPALAVGLFRRVADDWPASPYAPKALLAVGQLDPSEAEASRARLDSLYPDSPYLALVRGQDAPGYRELEDSLAAFAGKQVVRARPTFRGNPRRAMEPADSVPGDRRRQRRAADEDKPGKRRSPDQ